MVTDFGNGEALRACKPGDAGEALVELLGLGCSAGAWADHGAGASSGFYEAVGYELVVGLLDRGRVDAEVGCETANWIKLVAVTELTVSDGRTILSWICLNSGTSESGLRVMNMHPHFLCCSY